jgi:hypothetical protein
MNRWFIGLVLAGVSLAGTGTLIAQAQPMATPSPAVSPMVSASPTPVSTMQP